MRPWRQVHTLAWLQLQAHTLAWLQLQALEKPDMLSIVLNDYSRGHAMQVLTGMSLGAVAQKCIEHAGTLRPVSASIRLQLTAFIDWSLMSQCAMTGFALCLQARIPQSHPVVGSVLLLPP